MPKSPFDLDAYFKEVAAEKQAAKPKKMAPIRRKEKESPFRKFIAATGVRETLPSKAGQFLAKKLFPEQADLDVKTGLFSEFPQEKLGTLGKITSAVGSIALDPTMLLAGGVGNLAARGTAAALGKSAVTAGGRLATAAVGGAGTLGAMTASRQPFEQLLAEDWIVSHDGKSFAFDSEHAANAYANQISAKTDAEVDIKKPGEFRLGEFAIETLKSAGTGAVALGIPGAMRGATSALARSPVTRLTAESGLFAAQPTLMYGAIDPETGEKVRRLPTQHEFAESFGTIMGLRAVGAVSQRIGIKDATKALAERAMNKTQTKAVIDDKYEAPEGIKTQVRPAAKKDGTGWTVEGKNFETPQEAWMAADEANAKLWDVPFKLPDKAKAEPGEPIAPAQRTEKAARLRMGTIRAKAENDLIASKGGKRLKGKPRREKAAKLLADLEANPQDYSKAQHEAATQWKAAGEGLAKRVYGLIDEVRAARKKVPTKQPKVSVEEPIVQVQSPAATVTGSPKDQGIQFSEFVKTKGHEWPIPAKKAGTPNQLYIDLLAEYEGTPSLPLAGAVDKGATEAAAPTTERIPIDRAIDLFEEKRVDLPEGAAKRKARDVVDALEQSKAEGETVVPRADLERVAKEPVSAAPDYVDIRDAINAHTDLGKGETGPYDARTHQQTALKLIQMEEMGVAEVPKDMMPGAEHVAEPYYPDDPRAPVQKRARISGAEKKIIALEDPVSPVPKSPAERRAKAEEVATRIENNPATAEDNYAVRVFRARQAKTLSAKDATKIKGTPLDPILLSIGDEFRMAGQLYRVKDVDPNGDSHAVGDKGLSIKVDASPWKSGDVINVNGTRMEIVEVRGPGDFMVTPDGKTTVQANIGRGATRGKPLIIDEGTHIKQAKTPDDIAASERAREIEPPVNPFTKLGARPPTFEQVREFAGQTRERVGEAAMGLTDEIMIRAGMQPLSERLAHGREAVELGAEVRGAQGMAELRALERADELTKMLGPNSTEVDRYRIGRAVAGQYPLELLSEGAQRWVRETREIIDADSRALIEELTAHYGGEATIVEAIKKNLGSYVQELIRNDGESMWWNTSRRKKLRPGQFMRKRDKWTVVAGKRGIKFESEQEARSFLKNIARKGLPGRGVSAEAMQSAMKGKKIRIEAPLTEADRLQMDFERDPRWQWAHTHMNMRHNLGMLRYSRHLWEKYGQQIESSMAENPPPEGKADLKAYLRENGWAKVEGSKNAVGILHDKYLPKRFAAELNEVMREPPGGFTRAMEAYLQMWKASKVITNPATHVRNMAGNAFVFSVLADNSALNPLNARFYVAARKDLINKGPAYRALLKSGAIGGEYFGNELRKTESELGPDASPLEIVSAMGKRMYNRMGEIYNAEDQIFKVATYIKYMQKGYRGRTLDSKASARQVNKWYPNYAELPPWVRKWARSWYGHPFVAFNASAAKIYARAISEKPLRLAMANALPLALSGMAVMALRGGVSSWISEALGGDSIKPLTDDELEMINERRSWADVILGFRNKNGAIPVMPLTWNIPFAHEFLEIHNAITGEMSSVIRPPVALGHPLTVTFADFMYNKKWNGAPIWREDDDMGTRWGKAAIYAAKQLAPLPSVLVHGVPRIAKAATRRSDEHWANAIGGALFGISMRQPYVDRNDAYERLRTLAAGDPYIRSYLTQYLGHGFPDLPLERFTLSLEGDTRFQNILELFNEAYLSVGGAVGQRAIDTSGVASTLGTQIKKMRDFDRRFMDLKNLHLSTEMGLSEMKPFERTTLDRMQKAAPKIAGILERMADPQVTPDEFNLGRKAVLKLIREANPGTTEEEQLPPALFAPTEPRQALRFRRPALVPEMAP